jgi:SagB-type dehydrogenase family enzyme
MGCRAIASGVFADDEVAQLCGLSEDEWPMLLVAVYPTIPMEDFNTKEIVRFGGEPNHLSPQQIAYPSINGIQAATKITRPFNDPLVRPAMTGSGSIQLPPPATSSRSFGDVARKRRSALDFTGGSSSISLEQLSAILASASSRFIADFAGDTRFIQLYLYAHRVRGLPLGVYRYWPEGVQLELIRSGDQRVAAAGVSLGQDLAGNACVAFSMIADLERATATYGDRGYRYVHFEAGAIGQCLYLTAEALGIGATGIGAFFDDKVHAYLNITPQQGQVIYHFAIGYPVPDPRLSA